MAQPPWQNDPAEIAAALAASQATYAQEQSNAVLAARRAENARLQNLANQANINKAIASSGGGGGGGGGGRPRVFEPAAGEIPFKDIRPTGTDDNDGSPIWEDAFTQEEIGQGTVLIDFQMPDGRFISSLGRYIVADQLDALLRRGTNPFATDLPLRIEDITQYRANKITGLKFSRARGEALFRFAGDRGATIRFDADGTVGISESTRRLLEPSMEERLRMTKPEYEQAIAAARNLNRRGNAGAVAAWRRVGRGPLGRTDEELFRAVEIERNPPAAAAARANEDLPPGWVFKPYRRGPYAGKSRWYHYEHNTYTNRKPRGAFGLGELNLGNDDNENNNNNNDRNNRPLARPTTPPIGSGRGGAPVRRQEDDNNREVPKAGARAEVEDLVEIPIIGVRPSGEYVAGGEVAAKLISKEPPKPHANKWLNQRSNGRQSDVEFTFFKTYLLKQVYIMSANDEPSRDPVSINILGHGHEGWKVFKKELAIDFDARHQWKVIEIDDPLPIDGVKIMILKTRGGGWDTYTQLARVKFMGLPAKNANNNGPAAAVASTGGGGGGGGVRSVADNLVYNPVLNCFINSEGICFFADLDETTLEPIPDMSRIIGRIRPGLDREEARESNFVPAKERSRKRKNRRNRTRKN